MYVCMYVCMYWIYIDFDCLCISCLYYECVLYKRDSISVHFPFSIFGLHVAPLNSNHKLWQELKLFPGCYCCTTLHHYDLMRILVCPCVCACCIWVWLMSWLKCCCVSAGLRGSAQSGAEGLRSRLDHRHQSAGGNPHLFAVSCATLEGKTSHEHVLWTAQSLKSCPAHSVRYKDYKTACDNIFFARNVFMLTL